jgi:hypothetical protein
MKHTAVFLAVALLLLSSVLIGYRILWLGYPLLPTAPGRAWELSMEAHVKPDEKDLTVMIGLPRTEAERIIVEEKIHSGALNFNLLRRGPNQIGVWSGTLTPEGEIIGYHATILVRPQRASKSSAPPLDPFPAVFEKTEQAVAKRLVEKWIGLPPPDRFRAVVAALTGTWGTPLPDRRDMEVWSTFQERDGRLTSILMLLRAADLPARAVTGLHLVESVAASPFTWVEVWTGQGWERFHPETGEIFKKSILLLPLMTGDSPAVSLSRGQLLEAHWALSRQVVSRWRMHFERITRSGRFLDRWSLFRLPSEFQETFRILLLVPIGALMICVLRNLVGFPTFGIFMPVLMALAFRSTGLLYGLGIFAGVVLIGYLVRRWIDKLRLLLVPRLSLILTLVVIFFTVLALIGSKLGLRQFMAVGLLPFVILTMTIERFFVITEEAGIREGLWTAAGSAAVATITYEILYLEFLQLTFFVYPELLFVVAATQVLLGRYTGYRLSELLRFRKFRNNG